VVSGIVGSMKDEVVLLYEADLVKLVSRKIWGRGRGSCICILSSR
jgi:hypothetical protein